MSNRILKLTLVVVSGLFLAIPMHAGLLGSTLGWQYYAYGGAYNLMGGTTSGTFIDNGGIGGTFIGGTSSLYFNIIADDNSITFDYSIASAPGTWSPSVLSLAPTIYNGIAIDMVSGPAFTSVTIDPATNMVGFNSSDFSFTGSQIEVNWANLAYTNSTIVKLDVNTSQGGVPEPGAWILLGSGLGALVVWRKRPRGAVRG